MILVDTTIVSVATPAIIEDLHAGVNDVVWVTSAYLLAYAVPVLITGRLGDRFGPKRLYLTGLTVFTLASLWCGLTGTITALIIARVVQGLGASMITPQTMAIITRIFPQARRGAAMALWGATAGVATLVGPILGGVLVDALGWEWIFFINVPVGVVGFALAWRLVPTLPTHSHSFDWLGVALSGLGMFLLVFGIQEGHQYSWSAAIWSMITAGLVVLAAFVWWQARNKKEPLVPLSLFRDRNFSLANVAISVMGFSITAMVDPDHDLGPGGPRAEPDPVGAAPGADGAHDAPAGPAGRPAHRPRPPADHHGVRVRVPVRRPAVADARDDAGHLDLVDSAADGRLRRRQRLRLGAEQRHRDPQPAGAAGRRRLPASTTPPARSGAVLGSAAIAVLIDSRLAAEGLPSFSGRRGPARAAAPSRPRSRRRSATRWRPSVLLPVAAFVLGFIAVLFFQKPRHQGWTTVPDAATPKAAPAAEQTR